MSNFYAVLRGLPGLRLAEAFTSAFLVFGDLLAVLLVLFERLVRFSCGEISLTGGSNLNGLLSEVGKRGMGKGERLEFYLSPFPFNLSPSLLVP